MITLDPSLLKLYTDPMPKGTYYRNDTVTSGVFRVGEPEPVIIISTKDPKQTDGLVSALVLILNTRKP